MKATAAALLAVAGLSWQAQAETLALRCEGIKITIERKEPDEMKKLFPHQSAGEEDKERRTREEKSGPRRT
jgi:hypothetical protein